MTPRLFCLFAAATYVRRSNLNSDKLNIPKRNVQHCAIRTTTASPRLPWNGHFVVSRCRRRRRSRQSSGHFIFIIFILGSGNDPALLARGPAFWPHPAVIQPLLAVAAATEFWVLAPKKVPDLLALIISHCKTSIWHLFLSLSLSLSQTHTNALSRRRNF